MATVVIFADTGIEVLRLVAGRPKTKSALGSEAESTFAFKGVHITCC